MSESTLSVDYDDAAAKLCFYMHGQRSTASLSADEAAELDDCIQQGYRQYLWPPKMEGEVRAHEWSFLRPAWTQATVAGDSDYDLADDVTGIVGPLVYAPSDDHPGVQIRITNEAHILHLQSLDNSQTGYPLLAAVRPKTTDGTASSRYELLVWPTPDAVVTLKARANIAPNKWVTGKYPYGGPQHHETLLASCMAMAELKMHDQRGPHGERFLQLLAMSINRDTREHAAEFLGYNGDRKNGLPRHLMRKGGFLEHFGPMTVNGVEYTG